MLNTLEDGIFKPNISPGEVVVTPGALETFHNSGNRISPLLLRHVRGDYGDLCPEDVAENEYSIKHGFRIVSKYALTDGTEIFVITEADRSVTTFLLVSEY